MDPFVSSLSIKKYIKYVYLYRVYLIPLSVSLVEFVCTQLSQSTYKEASNGEFKSSLQSVVSNLYRLWVHFYVPDLSSVEILGILWNPYFHVQHIPSDSRGK